MGPRRFREARTPGPHGRPLYASAAAPLGSLGVSSQVRSNRRRPHGQASTPRHRTKGAPRRRLPESTQNDPALQMRN